MRWHQWALAFAICSFIFVLADVVVADTPSGPLTKSTTLKVSKRLIPTDDPGRFHLRIDAVDHALSVGNGGTTGPIQVTTGLHIVRERAANAATNLCNYVITYSGDCAANAHVTLSAGQNKSCLITNRRREWVARTPMPTARLYFATGVIGTKIYVAGGQLGTLSKLEVYDTVANSWATKAPMPTARTGLAAGVINGIYYAVGGSGPSGAGGSQVLGTLEAYDPATNTWTTKASMPTPREGLAVAVVSGKLYAIGGNGSVFGAAIKKVEVYDSITNTWATKAPMLTSRSWHGVGVMNNKIYVVGGRSGSFSSSPITSSHMYNPGNNTWSTMSAMPTARFGIAVAAANGKLYAVGHWATNQAFNPSNASWFTGIPIPTGRWFLGVAAVNNVIYAIGGESPQGSPLRKVEAFTPC